MSMPPPDRRKQRVAVPQIFAHVLAETPSPVVGSDSRTSENNKWEKEPPRYV